MPERDTPRSQQPASWTEEPLVFAGSQGPLVGVLARPRGKCRCAMLIVAGQPHTRVGAQRLHTELARRLAGLGIASLRFDVGGWGDSPGEPLPFEQADRDIAAGAATLRTLLPGARRLWLLGLGDGASAAVLALPALRERGVIPNAICLANPGVRDGATPGMVECAPPIEPSPAIDRQSAIDSGSDASLADTREARLHPLRTPLRYLRALFGGSAQREINSGPAAGPASAPMAGIAVAPATASPADLPTRLLVQLAAFEGNVCTVLSGSDLSADDTEALMKRDSRWRKKLDRRGALLRVPGADHAFSDPADRDTVARWLAAQARA